MPLRFATALAAALAAACFSLAPTAQADAPCGKSGYSYAGLQSLTAEHGIGATLTSLATPLVENGHVAAWVGVGAPGEGPGGADEWLQVGLNSVPGSGNKLYYEIARPGVPVHYAEVDSSVPTGQQRKLAVLEIANQPNHWRVWVNDRPVSGSIYLPQSHGTLTPMATAESWDGGQPSCNRYSYRFRNVVLAGHSGGDWQDIRKAYVMQDPGYRVVRHESAFLASALRPIPTSRKETGPVAKPKPTPAPAKPQSAPAQQSTPQTSSSQSSSSQSSSSSSSSSSSDQTFGSSGIFVN